MDGGQSSDHLSSDYFQAMFLIALASFPLFSIYICILYASHFLQISIGVSQFIFPNSQLNLVLTYSFFSLPILIV